MRRSAALHAVTLLAAVVWAAIGGASVGSRWAITELVGLGLLLVGSSSLFERLTVHGGAAWAPVIDTPHRDDTPVGELTALGGLIVYGSQSALLIALLLGFA